MLTEKKLRTYFVISLLFLLWFGLIILGKNIELKEKNIKIEELTKKADSLYNENLPCQIELGRYEVALSILKEENPEAAAQYEHIISTKTE